MVILVGPTPEDVDGPIPVEIETELRPVSHGDLSLVYEDEQTRDGTAQRVVRVARDAYSDGLDLARRCAALAVRQFGELKREARPDEIEMQIAIKVDAGVAALVKSGAEAQLQVTFRWRTNPAGLTSEAAS